MSNQLKDALYNISTDNLGDEPDEAHVRYGKGILVGVIAATMHWKEVSFEEAVAEVLPHMPDPGDVHLQTIPGPWLDAFIAPLVMPRRALKEI